MNIGLTGGIASGKSTVSKMLVELGAHLVDADQIAREVVAPGHPVLSKVVSHFGQDILLTDGSLNRKKLGKIIFHDPSKKKALESILHPPIRAVMLERMRILEQQHPDQLVAVDVPLLYESGLSHYFDEVWVVYVPKSVQLERLMKRNQLTEAEAEARINAQWPIEKKKELADVVIDNSGSIEQTKAQVEALWKRKGLQ